MAMAGWTTYESNCQDVVSDINVEDIEALAGFDITYYRAGNQSGTDVEKVHGVYNTSDFPDGGKSMEQFVERRCPYNGGGCNTPMSGHDYIHADGYHG